MEQTKACSNVKMDRRVDYMTIYLKKKIKKKLSIQFKGDSTVFTRERAVF